MYLRDEQPGHTNLKTTKFNRQSSAPAHSIVGTMNEFKISFPLDVGGSGAVALIARQDHAPRFTELTAQPKAYALGRWQWKFAEGPCLTRTTK